jgi:hypothetical protein
MAVLMLLGLNSRWRSFWACWTALMTNTLATGGFFPFQSRTLNFCPALLIIAMDGS